MFYYLFDLLRYKYLDFICFLKGHQLVEWGNVAFCVRCDTSYSDGGYPRRYTADYDHCTDDPVCYGCGEYDSKCDCEVEWVCEDCMLPVSGCKCEEEYCEECGNYDCECDIPYGDCTVCGVPVPACECDDDMSDEWDVDDYIQEECAERAYRWNYDCRKCRLFIDEYGEGGNVE